MKDFKIRPYDPALKSKTIKFLTVDGGTKAVWSNSEEWKGRDIPEHVEDMIFGKTWKRSMIGLTVCTIVFFYFYVTL